MKKRLPFVLHEEEQVKEFRKDPRKAVDYLNACIEVAFKENDPELILTSLAVLAKADGMAQIARHSKLPRESIHRMLSRRGNPEWGSIFRLFRALHVIPRFERLRPAA